MNERISRRDLLKYAAGLAGTGITGLVLTGCDRIKIVDPTSPTVVPSKPTAGPDAASRPDVKTGLKAGEFILTGFPDRVDAVNVLAAKGADAFGNTFKNTIGLGTEMIFAEPGVLKVGPEFPQAEFTRLGRSVERYNPSNQAVIATQEGFWSVREGGFTMINGNNMRLEVAGNDGTKPFVVDLGGDEVNHWIVAIRGLFPDAKTPTDRNRTVKVSNHPAGHTLVDSYPLGAYISEGQLKQIVENAHRNYPNSGDAGSPDVRMLLIDLNTGAYSAVAQKGLNESWVLSKRNW